MKKIALLIVTLLVVTAFSGIWCYADAPDSSYQLTLSDEFNGTELNTDMWYHRTGNPYGGKNLAENVRIANGKLYLDYTKTDGIYSGGGIITNNYLPYGYYETKAKVFTGVNGFHSSFWTAGGILEIDCFEIDSNQGTTAPPPYYNLHYWWADHSMLGGKAFYNNAAGNGFTSDWFVAGFEWLPGKIIFYCNGKEVGSVNPDVYSPSDLWLTAVAVPEWHKNSDGTYNIDDSKMDANGYFGSSEYEYFRYYNKKLKGVNLLGNSHFELNRNVTATNIRSFTVVKNAASLKTPYAHNGYCVAYLSDTAELGQNLNNIVSGNYTFEGYFKTKGSTSATISVYDADGTLLKSASIPQCNDWTLVSLNDVSVTDSAYAVVKTTSGVLLADDLSFYCQEGDATYASYQEGDYKNYNALPANTDYPVLDSALIAQLDSSVYQYKNNPYAFSKTDSSLVPYKENGEIYVPYQAIKSDISISGVDSQATYVSLSQINASGTYKAHTNGSCIIICKASDKVDNSVILSAQVSINYFRDPTSRETRTATYTGTSDVANQLIYDIDTATLTGSWGTSGLGYASKGKYIGNAQGTATWMPTDLTPNEYTVQIYSASHQGAAGGAAPSTSKAGVDLTIGTKTYSYTLNQYNGSTGWYSLGSFELNLSELMAIKLYNASGEGILRASAIRLIPKDLDEAIYVGTDNEDNQIVYDINSCNLSGSWGTSGLGYTGGSRYASESLASATWNFAPSGAGSYSIQLYSIAHAGDTNTGAAPSTTAAGVRLELSDATHHYLINQCTGSTGWYDLGTFTFDAGESASITIHHTLFDGLLRANAIRLVPDVINEATYVGTDNENNQIVYDINSCTLSGSWGTSGLGYTGGSRYTGGSDATATWSISPTSEGNYSVQVYSVAHAGDIASGAPASTTAAGVRFEISGEKHRYLLNQCTGPTGWYDLGTFAFEANQTASITLYKTLDDGHLRASAVRLVPKAPDTESGTISFVGKNDVTGQKLFGFDVATTTGKWLSSGGALLGCYYGDGTAATAKWNMIPDNTQKYSVQVYVPCIENANTTVNGVITLEIGNRTIQYPMNQRLDTTTYMGWYTLGEFYLTKNEGATVTLSMTDGQFLRAKSARLVPVADTFSVTQSGTTVNIDTGYAYGNVESVVFVEYDGSGMIVSTKILDCTQKITAALTNSSNNYKIFFWKSIPSMVPFRAVYEK